MGTFTRWLPPKGKFLLAFLFHLLLSVLVAQQASSAQEPSGNLSQWNDRLMEAVRSSPGNTAASTQDYRIGPEDLIEIGVFEVPELSRNVRVSAAGQISLPLIGTVKAGGLSPLQLEQVLTDMLRDSYLKDPQVSVFLREFKSDPVSVVGAVKMPGLYHIQTRKSVIEVLAMAQGFSEGPLRQPGRTIIITRGLGTRWVDRTAESGAEGPLNSPANNPLDGKLPDSIEIPIKQLLESGDPKWNVPVFPGDVIRVAPAGTFYVAGDVTRPGGFPLTDFDTITVIQALAMAGGPTKSASLKNAIIVRRDEAGNRIEEKVDLKRVMQGKDREARLAANDILIVPGSVTKQAALRAIESSIQVVTGVLIWRR